MIRVTVAACMVATAIGGCRPSDEAPSAEIDTSPATSSANHLPTQTDRTAILATVQSLFDALASGDGQVLRDIMHPNVLMHSVERAADGTRSSSTSTLDQLVARVEDSEAVLTERMWDPEVRVSGDLAMVWTPYDFYVGDEFSHCGADAFVLSRSGESWKVVALSWTRLQPPECELHPDGPP